MPDTVDVVAARLGDRYFLVRQNEEYRQLIVDEILFSAPLAESTWCVCTYKNVYVLLRYNSSNRILACVDYTGSRDEMREYVAKNFGLELVRACFTSLNWKFRDYEV